MRGDEFHRQEKLVPRVGNIPKHSERNMSKIRTLRERLLKVKGVKFQRKNNTRFSNDENKDEGLYNELKSWKPTSGS